MDGVESNAERSLRMHTRPDRRLWKDRVAREGVDAGERGKRGSTNACSFVTAQHRYATRGRLRGEGKTVRRQRGMEQYLTSRGGRSSGEGRVELRI